MSAIDLRKEVQDFQVDNGAQLVGLQFLDRAIRDALAGYEPGIDLFIGPSRVGKSELLRILKAHYPASRVDGKLSCPVLIVSVKSGTAPRGLPLQVLRALGVPIPRGARSQGQLDALMLDQLEIAGVRVILFEECSHLVDAGTKVMPRQAADWFKDLSESRVRPSLILVGLPRLRKLITCNDQLGLRANAPFVLAPYRWNITAEREEFSSFCGAYVDKLEEHGFSFAMPLPQFVRHLYAVSSGLVGVVAKFFRQLAKLLHEPCLVSNDQLCEAFLTLNSSEQLSCRPFEDEALSDAQLLRTLDAVVDEYGLRLPRATKAFADKRNEHFSQAHVWRTNW